MILQCAVLSINPDCELSLKNADRIFYPINIPTNKFYRISIENNNSIHFVLAITKTAGFYAMVYHKVNHGYFLIARIANQLY